MGSPFCCADGRFVVCYQSVKDVFIAWTEYSNYNDNKNLLVYFGGLLHER